MQIAEAFNASQLTIFMGHILAEHNSEGANSLYDSLWNRRSVHI